MSNKVKIPIKLKAEVTLSTVITSKSKSTKKKKTGPKRPLSSYMWFAQANRHQVKKDNPDLYQTEICKILGQKWNELSDDEKKPFEKQYQNDKARYEKELEECP